MRTKIIPKTLTNMHTMALLLLQLIPPFSLNNATQVQTVPQEKALQDFLFKEYSKYARPVLNNSKPVVVTFGFTLVQVISVVERDQYITTKLWMRITWLNEFMKWDPEMWGRITKIRLNSDTVWIPDVFCQEDLGEEISAGPYAYKTPISIESTGKHSWLIPVKLQTSCIFDVTKFPFDRQSCQLTFGSWTHDRNEIELEIETKDVVGANYINATEWTLLDVKKNLVSLKYQCCPNEFVEIRFTIELQRKALYYVYIIITPCIIQMVIILFTFFLPPDSGERVGLTMTVLLVFAIYLDVLSGSLPKTSTSTPLLSHFYTVTLIECACSLVATCFVLAVHFKGAEKGVGAMPQCLRNYFLTYLAKMVGVTPNVREYTNDLLALKSKENNGLDDNEHSKVACKNETNNDKGRLKGDATASKEGRMKDGANKSKKGIDVILNEVHVITSLIRDMNRQDEIEEEWQVLAKVLDRMFFVLFTIMFLVTSLAILLPVYLEYRM